MQTGPAKLGLELILQYISIQNVMSSKSVSVGRHVIGYGQFPVERNAFVNRFTSGRVSEFSSINAVEFTNDKQCVNADPTVCMYISQHTNMFLIHANALKYLHLLIFSDR